MYPIKHIVIIFKENHTFDNYFGTFPGANGTNNLLHAANPPLTDHPHTHEAWLKRGTNPVKEQYHESDIPKYFELAKTFTLCDNYFTDVAGPSTPNHLMVIAGDSPIIDNPSLTKLNQPVPPFAIPSLPSQLATAGLTWKNYGGYAQRLITDLVLNPQNTSADQFVKDATQGTLPNVSWVYGPTGLSEHPTENITQGQDWTVQQIDALVKGGLWKDSVIFITWDDWGGWYDHVTPAAVENWKDGTQFRYGSRVGCIVVSPFAKSGYICHTLHSHVSLVKFAETIFQLPAVHPRVAESSDMMDCFDFSQQPVGYPTTL